MNLEELDRDLTDNEFEQVFGEMLPLLATEENASLLVLTLQRLQESHHGFWFDFWRDSNKNLTAVVWQTVRQRERMRAYGQLFFWDGTCSTNKVNTHGMPLVYLIELDFVR
jgi:hypothetical protein